MNRGELLRAIDNVDMALLDAKRANDQVFLLEKIFPIDECDFTLADDWLGGDFDAVKAVLFRELKDERLCGRLAWRSLSSVISDGIYGEYKERGYQTLQNGLKLTEENVRKMLRGDGSQHF